MFSHHFSLLNMIESGTRVLLSQKAVSVIHDVLPKSDGSSKHSNERITNACVEKDVTKRIEKEVATKVSELNGNRKLLQDWNKTVGVSDNRNLFFGLVQNREDEKFRGNRSPLDDLWFGSDVFLSDRDFRGESDVYQVNDKMELESELSGYEEDRGSSQGPDDESSVADFRTEKDISTATEADNDYGARSIAEVLTSGKRGDNKEEPASKDHSSSSSPMDCEKADKMESMWEHQELIDQLRMELKRARIPSLPTIVEETESPRVVDESKCCKTTECFQHEHHMHELQKVFKSYREKMRKFDILNYQKMYAMGFMQLTNCVESTPTRNPSSPKLKSLVSKSTWLSKQKRDLDESNKKLIKEFQADLEVVYVGQMCLSWEFLNWQYQKALDLCDSDPYGTHQYEATSGEFHQFQTLLRRFVDDEPFQGKRAEHFVQSRCILCNLLQVPVIKEDSFKHKSTEKLKGTGKGVVTIDELVRVVEESIRVFWQFVQADKHCITSNDCVSKKSELLNPRDLKLQSDVLKDLHKKRKKLKEILKEEKCILKKLKQSMEDNSVDEEDLYFLCQMDMILVSRVLNMPKITREQLIWCCDKLNKITFMDDKVYVEPALLFFPC